ncbi:MAG: hypothetical protein H3C69_09340 [Candidatus Promineofilum sp.]|nr:hypothetical protein [Promineifilum sp.]
MTYLALFFVGSVYFINGLAILNLVDSKASAPLNIFVGSLLLAVTAYLIVPLSNLSTSENLYVVVNSIGYLLFAFTFLYVGIVNYSGHSNIGLGWYCGWSALVSACLSVTQFVKYGDYKSGALWAVWTIVFIAFFVMIIGKTNRFDRAIGWFIIIAGFTTCFVPGGLMILGVWEHLSNGVVFTMEFGTIALFGVLPLLLRSATQAAESRKRV